MDRPPHLKFWSCVTAILAVITYWRFFQMPLISDDFTVLWISRTYGEPGGWNILFSDALYRCRAIYMILTHFMDRWFGLDHLPYNITGVLFHVVNSLLVLALGSWKQVGYTISIPAAVYFAVQSGHQEAVVWYSALPDQMAMLFIMLSLFACLAWLRNGRWFWYAAALGCYLLALFSKESGVIACGLFGLMMLVERKSIRFITAAIAPFVAIAAIYFAAGFAARSSHLHYNDGTFALGLHFIPVIGRSIFRMLWVWGLLALAAIFFWKRAYLRIVWLAFGWMTISLLPYAFLKYMPFVPSRHTYIATAGLALIVGSGLLAIRERLHAHRIAMALLVAAVIASEWGYLWTRKYKQYLERAAPTEEFLAKLTHRPVEVVIRCFPFGSDPVLAIVKLQYGANVRISEKKVHPNTPGCNTNGLVDVIFD